MRVFGEYLEAMNANPGKTATELFAVYFPIFESKTADFRSISK
jgi:hypothetical protein